MIGQLVLGLSLLVGLHEFGHFGFAKLFKIKVTKFYIFFDFLFPLPNVLNFSLLKKKIGETEYGIGWFPLGGYVAIHGMVDETQDADALAGPPQPDEFRSKPAWQRLLVMLGGIIMNVITGIAIFSALTFVYGEKYLPASEARYGIVTTKLGRLIGLRNGDKIVKINGRPYTEFDDVRDIKILLGSHGYYTVERGGQLLDINIPSDFARLMTKYDDSIFVAPRMPFAVESIESGTAADKAGLKAKDEILAVGTIPTPYFDRLQAALRLNAGHKTTLTVLRDGQRLQLPITVNATGTIGFHMADKLNYGKRYYSLLNSVPRGAKDAFGVLTTQAKAVGMIITGKLPFLKSVGGPQDIAKQYGGIWDWPHFWFMTGALSMVLAFMNLLPIPALDGGHVVFLLYEMILRRKPSDAFLENAQRVGTLLILALMFLVILGKPILGAFGLLE
jgi:regulator of sigma E protease